MTLNAGIVGYGYWGPNILRNLVEIEDYKLLVVVESREDRAALAKKRYPAILVEKVLTNKILQKLDVLFICTPTNSHFKLAKLALDNKTHVWVEKPMTLDSKLAEQLILLAKAKNLSIAVDHTYLYSPGIEKTKQLIEQGEIGRPLYYDSLRANLGIFQQDVSVIWDLAIHDLSILDFIFSDYRIEQISCRSFNPLLGNTNSLAYFNISYDNGFVANISTNWLSPVKLRRVTFGGSTSTIVFDDTKPADKVKIFTQEFIKTDDMEQEIQNRVSYKLGSTLIPKLDQTEALQKGLRVFAHHILRSDGESYLRNSGERALKLIKILEIAEKSSRELGKPMEFKF